MYPNIANKDHLWRAHHMHRIPKMFVLPIPDHVSGPFFGQVLGLFGTPPPNR